MKKHYLTIFALVLLCLMAGGRKAHAIFTEPRVTWNPQSVQYPVLSDATYSATFSGQNLEFTWYVEYGGKEYEMPAQKDALMNAGMKNQCSDIWISSTANRTEIVFTSIHEDIGLKDGKFTKVRCEAFDGNTMEGSSYAYVSCNGMYLSQVTMPPMIYVKPVVGVKPDSVGKIGVTVWPANEAQVQDIEYQWYEYTGGEIMTGIKAMAGEDASVLVSGVGPGEYADFVVGVFVKLKNGNEIVSYSSPINVYGEMGDIDYSHDQLRVVRLPDRNGYTLGDKVDLTGLQVEYIANDKSQGIIPISDLETDITTFTYAGPVWVTVGYKGETNGFTVWVDPKDGDWEMEPPAPPTEPVATEAATTAPTEAPTAAPTEPETTKAPEPSETATEAVTTNAATEPQPQSSTPETQKESTAAPSASAPAPTQEAPQGGGSGNGGNTLLIVLIVVLAAICGLLAGVLIGKKKEK